MWREGLGAYKIVTGEVDGGSYKNHPAVKEFIDNPGCLWMRLANVRHEMLKRGYHPKPMPHARLEDYDSLCSLKVTPWQTLEEQIEIIRNKHCKCNI